MLRTCLNLHTKMSELEGVVDFKEYMCIANELGIKALGITDIESVQAFKDIYMFRDEIKEKNLKILYGTELKISPNYQSLVTLSPRIHIYAKNRIGLRNLYILLSQEKKFGELDLQDEFFQKHLDGLIIGSGSMYSEIYLGYLLGLPETEIEEVAQKYDFIEIQLFYGEEINHKIIKLANRLNKLVVATDDIYFINENDYISQKILKYNYCNANDTTLRKDYAQIKNTEELLEQFAYLGKDMAYKVIIENPNKITDMCDEFDILPKKTAYPKLLNSVNSKKIIKEISQQRLKELYGEKIPTAVLNRYEYELNNIISNGFEDIYCLVYLIVQKSKADNEKFSLRGTGNSSLIAFLLGISFINPMEYNIPFEVFTGLDGCYEPDFDLDFSQDYQAKIQQYVIDLIGKEKVAYAGTINNIANTPAFHIFEKYRIENKQDVSNKNEIIENIIGVKTRIGTHPGGLVIAGDNEDIFSYTPIELKLSADVKNIYNVTHFDYHFLEKRLLTIDLLASDKITYLKELQNITGVNLEQVNIKDDKLFELFEKNNIGLLSDLYSTSLRDIILKVKPKKIEDLIRIIALQHGTGVWENNIEKLIEEHSLDELACSREDLYNYLMINGIEKDIAFKIMEFTRTGKAGKDYYKEKWNLYVDIMKKHNIPDWYISSMEKINYLASKAHCCNLAMVSLWLTWYKTYYPKQFNNVINKVYYE